MADCIYLQLMDKTHEKYQMVVDDIGDVVFYDEYTEFVYGFHRGIAGRWYAVDLGVKVHNTTGIWVILLQL